MEKKCYSSSNGGKFSIERSDWMKFNLNWMNWNGHITDDVNHPHLNPFDDYRQSAER